MQDHNVFIKWQPEYELGIPIIDEQHRGIVSVINSLYYSMQNKHIKGVLEPTINMLQSYTQIHFQTEEGFLAISNYPDTQKHILLHQQLVSRLAEISRKSMVDKDPYHLMDFLKKWWIDHICKVDFLYRDSIV